MRRKLRPPLPGWPGRVLNWKGSRQADRNGARNVAFEFNFFTSRYFKGPKMPRRARHSPKRIARGRSGHSILAVAHVAGELVDLREDQGSQLRIVAHYVIPGTHEAKEPAVDLRPGNGKM